MLNALVRFCTEAHISSRPFWGGIVGANVGRGVGRDVAIIGQTVAPKKLGFGRFNPNMFNCIPLPSDLREEKSHNKFQLLCIILPKFI